MKRVTYLAAIALLLLSTTQAHKAIEDDLPDMEYNGDAELEDQQVLDSQADSSVGDFQMPEPEIEGLNWKQKLVRFFSHEPSWYWKYYRFEVMALGLFMVGIVKYYLGSKENESIAMLWRQSCTPVFRQEFEHVGCNSDQQSLAMMQRSYSEYEYFASGRKNMYWADVKLNLCRRHCLFTTFTLDLMNGVTDQAVIEIPVHGKEIPLEFYVCKRKDLKTKMNTLSHLGSFVKNSNAKHYRLSDQQVMEKNALMIMSEHDEIANHLIDQEVGETLKKYGHVLHELHITDQKIYNGFPLYVRAVIDLPTSEADKEKIEANFMLIQLLCRLVDNATSLKLSSTVAQKCEKARKKQKQEEAQQKREQEEEKRIEAKREQERIERERLLRMTPEQQKKHEEKQRKKEQQRMKGKIMKVTK